MNGRIGVVEWGGGRLVVEADGVTVTSYDPDGARVDQPGAALTVMYERDFRGPAYGDPGHALLHAVARDVGGRVVEERPPSPPEPGAAY